MTLRLNLLGTFELHDSGGAPLALPTRFDQALLGYLAVHGTRAWPREHLAGLLWFNRSDAQARKSLRESLAGLRKVLGPAATALGPKRSSTLSFTATAIEVDALRLQTLTGSEAADTLEQAAALYRGPLMQGLSIRSPDYEDWLRCERERFADLAYRLIARLCEMHLSKQAWILALDAARRLTTIDPLREAGHRLLMQSLAGAGRRSEALRHYDELVHLLRQQLSVRPDPDSEMLRQAIKDGPAAVKLPLQDCRATGHTADAAAWRTRLTRPGLVVLPLKDMEGSADDSLRLGLTEELIGSLAAYRWLWVISLLQALMYRDRAIDPVDLGRELGVRYVVYGGLHRHANRVRLALSLAEVESGAHVWSGKFDCFPNELIDAQDELASNVARQIEPAVLVHEDEKALRQAPADLNTWQLTVRARRLVERVDQHDNALAHELAQHAIECDSSSAFAHATLAWADWAAITMGWADKQKAGPAAQAAAETATQLDPNYFLGHMALGALRLRHNRHEDATLALRAAKNLNPSFPMTYNCLIACLTYGGRPFEALEQLEPLDRISPSDPYFGYYRAVRSVTYFTVDDLPAALDCARSSQALRPGWLVSQAVQIAAAQRSGLAAEAAEAAESFRHYHPGLTVQQLRDRFNFRSDRDFCKLAEALFDAGLE